MDCSKCIFATSAPPSSGGPFGLWQDGCKVGRLEKLVERGEANLQPVDDCLENDELHQYYRLDRFCNMYRSSKWKRALKITNEVELQDKAKEETKTSFGVVIEISEQTEDELNKSIKSIIDSDYERGKIIASISAIQKGVHTQVLVNGVHKLLEQDIKADLVIHADSLTSGPFADKYQIDTDAFKRTVGIGCNFIVKIQAGQLIDSNFFNFIDKEVNELLNRTAFFEDTDSDVSALAYGVINSNYLDFLDYDLMVKEIKELAINQKNYRKYEKKI